VADLDYAGGRWVRDLSVYEAYVSFKPSPSLTLDAGKKTMKWGKGYVWNPAAFLDRPKNPDDPALALEGFVVLSADYIRTFRGPLQVMSITPVLLPVFDRVNAAFGRRGRVNAAGRIYALLYDTDVDFMFLVGGSRPHRVGFDVSRNLWSNLEVHAEWARTPGAARAGIDEQGNLVERRHAATSFVVGLRYLASTNTTVILDALHDGGGFSRAEMETWYDFVHSAHDEFVGGSGDERLRRAARAEEAAYGRNTAMRNYLYGRVTQPDALGIVYLSLGASAIVNLDDGSFSVLPEVQYKAGENLELRGQAGVLRGGARTEFGEKQADLRAELRVRYYF
jgi:hypothetical protein